MRRYTYPFLATLTLIAAGLIGSVATAQSIQWTGHYNIVVGKTLDGFGAAYGAHGAWNELRPVPAFKEGQFVDFAVRATPAAFTVDDIIAQSRYDLLAVGSAQGGAVSLSGYEQEGGPFFVDDPQVIPDMGTPYAVRGTSEGFLVVGARPPGGSVFTGDYVVAFGRHGKWEIAPGPDFHGGTFVDVAVGMAEAVDRRNPTELLAVGVLNDRAVTVSGSLFSGRPGFRLRAEAEEIPGVARPIGVEWTGAYYVVLGLDAFGSTVLVYGRPGQWSESKMVPADGTAFTGLAVASFPPTEQKPGWRYELLAVGALKGMAVTVAGAEADGLPLFDDAWAEVPGLTMDAGLVAATAVPFAFGDAVVAGSPVEIGRPFPNPFTNEVALAVTVASEQSVLVEVFDALGRRMAVLHNGPMAGGTSATFRFDGRGLAVGTYVFRVSGADFTEIRQVTLVR